MSGPVDPAPTLASSLAALEVAAVTAGLDPATARTEGERLAAAIAEATSGAPADWSSATGHSGTQAFFDAASQGRRWRASPTRLLGHLVLDESAHAHGYAEALAAVCSAAAHLGTPDARVLGNASVAASAQLRAAQPLSESAELSSSRLAALEPIRQRLEDLTRRGLTGLSPQGTGSTFDLPPDAGPIPGAFPGLGVGPPPTTGSTPGPSGSPAAASGPSAHALDPRQHEPAPAPDAEPEPQTLEELLAELDSLIGLDGVKAEIHRQVALLRVEKLRSEAGLRAPTLTRHLVFVGNPGTGKTTVARLVGGIYRALGLLSTGQLVEVDRSELVAGYLGQTAMKTSEVVASAVGGVLFIDEAYSLAGDQYGTEAVDTLVKEMEDHRDDLVLIVAGYPDPMVVFIGQNPGLSSRFRTTIEFDDYSDAELVDIFSTLARNADYDVTEECLTRFRTILAVTPRGPAFGNGRFARNQLEAAIGHHAWRLRDVTEPTLAQLRQLLADDLDGSAQEHSPDEPEPEQPLADGPTPEPWLAEEERR